jgi:uncharacterized protein
MVSAAFPCENERPVGSLAPPQQAFGASAPSVQEYGPYQSPITNHWPSFSPYRSLSARVKLRFFMTIQDQIEADLKDAMRAKQAERLSVLRMAKAALTNTTIEKYGAGGKLTDPESVVVVRKQVKQREDSVAGFEKGGRPELADKERREIEILSQYLPKALSEAEIKALVQEAIKEANATSKAQLGQVMKIATERAAGRVDGKTLSQQVRDALP